MTQMSDPHSALVPAAAAKSATRHVPRVLARALHSVARVRAILILSAASGCVIPPSLSVDKQDAGVDSPPSITKVLFDSQEIAEPGPVAYTRMGTGQLTLKLLDTDTDDTLYVRVFVDYNNPDPTPPRSTCTGVATANIGERSATCDMSGICQSSDVGQTRGMSIVVFDRMPLETGTQPLYQAIPEGGQSTSRFYYLKCQ